ncbi:MAG: argininosuccinate synthase [Verrucomicrobia bacterium]|nr:argininosuccinate synthase [Verrucomicrobiota bacterium]
MKKKVILAYSGGLDTSVILKWLINKGYEVICFIADVGQEEDLKVAEEKASAIGARKVLIVNLQEEFVEDYIFPSLKAHAVYEGKYLLGTALARPLIAAKLVEAAMKENTTCFAHGATGKGNDQVRFELTILKHIPHAEIISPWRDPEFLSQFSGRTDLLNYAKNHNIPVASTLEKPYSIDENLMHTSYEGGRLEDPAYTPQEEMFKRTASLKNTPDKELKIAIEFQCGKPITVEEIESGKKVIGSLELFKYLNEVGGTHGIGRMDLVESRFVGMKIRGVYETPAGTILLKAHLDLEGITLDREVMVLKESLAPKIAQIIYNGFWFSPEMDFLMAAINQSQKNVTGKVFLTLYKGNVMITGRSSPHSLYQLQLASMDEIGGYDQTDAKGFIKLNALRLMTKKETTHG